MFFLGHEIEIPDQATLLWRPVAGQFVKMSMALEFAWLAGAWLAWTSQNRLLLASILAITGAVLKINSLISATAFRLLGMTWNDSWWAGALLSQTGELGLLACKMATASGMIVTGLYKLAVAATGLALLLSTVWTSALRTILRR